MSIIVNFSILSTGKLWGWQVGFYGFRLGFDVSGSDFEHAVAWALEFAFFRDGGFRVQ